MLLKDSFKAESMEFFIFQNFDLFIIAIVIQGALKENILIHRQTFWFRD